MARRQERGSKLTGERFKKAKNIFGLSWKTLLDHERWGETVGVWDDRTLRIWTEKGIPENRIASVAQFFDVDGYLFSDPRIDGLDFEKALYKAKRRADNPPDIDPGVGGVGERGNYSKPGLRNAHVIDNFLNLKSNNSSMEVEFRIQPHMDGADRRGIVVVSEDEGPAFKIGDSIKMWFRCSRDAFVYLFNLNPDGKLSMVLPNGKTRSKKIAGGAPCEYPGPGEKWILEEPVGKETFKIITARDPVKVLDELIPDIGWTPFVEINDHSAEIIIEELENTPASTWTEETSSMVIYSR